jgi:hypothetical protein
MKWEHLGTRYWKLFGVPKGNRRERNVCRYLVDRCLLLHLIPKYVHFFHLSFMNSSRALICHRLIADYVDGATLNCCFSIYHGGGGQYFYLLRDTVYSIHEWYPPYSSDSCVCVDGFDGCIDQGITVTKERSRWSAKGCWSRVRQLWLLFLLHVHVDERRRWTMEVMSGNKAWQDLDVMIAGIKSEDIA